MKVWKLHYPATETQIIETRQDEIKKPYMIHGARVGVTLRERNSYNGKYESTYCSPLFSI